MSNKVIVKETSSSEILSDGLGKYFEDVLGFREMMMRYSCAIMEVETKLKVLNNDLSTRYNRNPIEVIKSRIKSPESIIEKLTRKGYDVTVGNMVRHLNDVAGVRVVCAFIDDIYEVAKMLARQDDIKVIEIKNYIKEPKDNGYRSYHMIVEIPVFFADKSMNMRVEVQIRTIAMDFWATIEHDLKYKKNIPWSEEISAELLLCAETINSTDEKMQEIRKRMDAYNASKKK